LSPIERYLKSIILYVGNRIDSVCKDGTTTSMIFACNFIRAIINRRQDLALCTLNEIVEEFKNSLDTLVEKMQDQIITVEDLEKDFNLTKSEAREILGYIQSMTATGNDREISKAVAEVCKLMPQEVLSDHVDIKTTVLEERDFRCKPVIHDYDFEMRSTLATTSYMFQGAGREVNLENCDLLIAAHPLSDVSQETQEFMDFIQQRVESSRREVPLVFAVAHSNNAVPSTVHDFCEHITREFGCKIIIIVYHSGKGARNYPWTSIALSGKANKPIWAYDTLATPDEALIKDVKIKITARNTYIYGLVKDHDPEQLIHPGIKNPEEFEYFTRYKELIDDQLDVVRSQHIIDRDELLELKTAEASLYAVRRMYLLLGGTSHENVEMRPIVEDAAGSAFAVLQHGIVLNAIFRMFYIMKQTKPQCVADEVLLEALELTAYSIYGGTFIPHEIVCEWNHMVDGISDELIADKYKYFDILTLRDICSPMKLRNKRKPILARVDVKNVMTSTELPPAQTASMIPEIALRLKEVGVRAGLMEMVTIPNTYTQSDK